MVFPESVRTYGRLRRDPKATAVLSAYFLPILRCNWVIDPEGVDRAEAVDLVAADLGLPILGQKGRPKDSPIRGFRWKEHVRLALLSLVYGLMPFERWFDTSSGRTRLAGIQERLPHTITNLDIDEATGAMRSVEQSTQLTPIPANRLTWYVNGKEGANWAGVSLLRACYTPWVLKHEVMRVHATSHRRWGMGVPVVHAPPGATPAQVEEARRLAAGMRAGDQAGAGLPPGFDFELAGMTGSTPDAVGFINFLNQEIAGSALAKVIELGTTSEGSRALGDTFLDLFLLALQAGADAIGDTATYGDPAMPGLSRALVDYNWGEDEPCPRIVATDVGDRHEITAAAIQQLVASGAITPDDELEGFLREAWSLPARKTPRPAPVPPPGTRAPATPTAGENTGTGGGTQPGGGGGGVQPTPSPPAQAPAAAWLERLHPRKERGEKDGGQFTRAPGLAGREQRRADQATLESVAQSITYDGAGAVDGRAAVAAAFRGLPGNLLKAVRGNVDKLVIRAEDWQVDAPEGPITAVGTYDPFAKRLSISAQDPTPRVVVHEALHAYDRNDDPRMPGAHSGSREWALLAAEIRYSGTHVAAHFVPRPADPDAQAAGNSEMFAELGMDYLTGRPYSLAYDTDPEKALPESLTGALDAYFRQAIGERV